MRKSKAETALSRDQILLAASRLFREHGPERVSVADVMKAAGMTHGGFYKHFASKDALLAAAIREAFSEKLGFLDSQSNVDPTAALDRYVEGYLTLEHVSDLATGCPIAGLAADSVRAGEEVSAAMAEGAQATIAQFAAAKGGDDKATADAIRTLSSMIGAVILARAVESPALQRDILRIAVGRDEGRSS